MSLTDYPFETGNIADFDTRYKPGPDAEVLAWKSRRLQRITRLRLVSDPGCPFWDVSYCWGLTTSGQPVRVRLPFHQLRRQDWASQILAWARTDGVHAKRLGVFDAVSKCW